ncbi:MAG TPA: GIY-YIG nuclease family protein, partial [Polyangiales bacterium]|nr:GIY-YIG nuclease family protein [Polyangiales bacterium]
EIQHAIDGVIERAANARAGYVYVISNIGSFGERVVKIGMTRRLDPMDRVRELGDASVPFRFDVHAIILSDDAVGLEGALHLRFASCRVNLVNNHREFFYTSPRDVKEALLALRGSLLSFNEAPEALEWHQSVSARPKS